MNVSAMSFGYSPPSFGVDVEAKAAQSITVEKGYTTGSTRARISTESGSLTLTMQRHVWDELITAVAVYLARQDYEEKRATTDVSSMPTPPVLPG